MAETTVNRYGVNPYTREVEERAWRMPRVFRIGRPGRRSQRQLRGWDWADLPAPYSRLVGANPDDTMLGHCLRCGIVRDFAVRKGRLRPDAWLVSGAKVAHRLDRAVVQGEMHHPDEKNWQWLVDLAEEKRWDGVDSRWFHAGCRGDTRVRLPAAGKREWDRIAELMRRPPGPLLHQGRPIGGPTTAERLKWAVEYDQYRWIDLKDRLLRDGWPRSPLAVERIVDRLVSNLPAAMPTATVIEDPKPGLGVWQFLTLTADVRRADGVTTAPRRLDHRFVAATSWVRDTLVVADSLSSAPIVALCVEHPEVGFHDADGWKRHVHDEHPHGFRFCNANPAHWLESARDWRHAILNGPVHVQQSDGSLARQRRCVALVGGAMCDACSVLVGAG
jgi:hypothetical protein